MQRDELLCVCVLNLKDIFQPGPLFQTTLNDSNFMWNLMKKEAAN